MKNNKGQYFFITRYGQKAPSDVDLKPVDEDLYLIFGSESSGIPKEILAPHLETCLRLPMTDTIRSLNLSNTVAILAYEALRQQGYPELSKFEPEKLKGKDYLVK